MTTCSTNTCGIGVVGTIPGDPDNNSILTATPAFGGIDVSWTYPVTYPHAVAHTILYRGIIPEFGAAMQRAVVAGNFFYDKIDANLRYYYWIQIVSVNGTYGELIGPASAVSKPTIEGMIELLTGQIDAGLLAQSLKGKLDEISLLNTNLLNEITARENGNITLAQAMEAVNNGVAEALTFIHQEINSRTTADSAIAEQINIVAATLNGTLASVSTAMSVAVDGLTGTVNSMWTAKVTVNDLIGGFGLANNGREVEAGFDVDRFWIGRTGANKRKPFIIDNGVVYIDEAAINKLTFSKLRDEAGTVVVEGGRLKADYVTIGDATISNAKMVGDIYSDNWHPSGGTQGWYLQRNTGSLYAQNAYIRGDITASNIVADTIVTGHIKSNQITVPWNAQTSGPLNITPTGVVIQTLPITCFGGNLFIHCSTNAPSPNIQLVLIRAGSGGIANAVGGSISFVDAPGPGGFTYQLMAYTLDGSTVAATYRNMTILESRR